MDYPWRPRLANANFCPVCSNPHFPFCSPPPPPHYFRPPPPPPDQFFHMRQPPPQPSYDPFVDHQGVPPVNPYPPPPPPAQVPPRPWSGNPNFGNNFHGNMYPEYDQNVQVGTKRMRFDNATDSSASSLSEDERRLKLIRDHGATSRLDKDSNHYVEPGNFSGKKETFGMNPQINPKYSDGNMAQSQICGNNVQGSDGYKNYNQPGGGPGAPQYDNAAYQDQSRTFPVGSKSGYHSIPNYGDNVHPVHVSPGFKSQSPLPPNPPPLMPSEPPRFRFPQSAVSFPASGPVSLFPISVDPASSFQPPLVSEGTASASSHYSSQATPNSGSYYSQEIQSMKIAPSKAFKGENEVFPPKHLPLDKPKLIDVSYILKHPHREIRPDYLVIILRGLPGSGKSYLAKILRDLEVENGGTAPRIHSMDEYFMTEVEKVEETEGSKSSSSSRGKRPTIKRVMEYCYEPEMEEAYRSSMLKAFKKTLDDGTFPFVIVDDRNLRVADFAQFWATAKKSGYEVYLLEATYKDPAGCAARNVHGFTQNDIQDMADQWEEAPSMYMKLDIKSLLHGDDLEENGIQEVDMDTDDGNDIGDPSGSEGVNHERVVEPSELDSTSTDRLKDESNGDAVDTHPVEEVKELGKSKWSNDLEEDNAHKTEATIENSSALSNLMKSYSKKGKSVRWADKVGSSIGFSIGSGKPGIVSLIIGPGSGYNSKTNPPPEDEKLGQRSGEPRKPTMFQEQLRAEGEAFKAVFDKRRHRRIGGLDGDDE